MRSVTRRVRGSAPSPRAISIASTSDSSSSSSDSSRARSYVHPMSPNSSAASRQSRWSMAAYGPDTGSSSSTSIPATAAQPAIRIANRPPRPPRGRTVGDELLEALGRHRRAGGESPLGRQLENRHDPLWLARAIGLSSEVGEPLGGIGIAPANGQLGQDRPRVELNDGDASLELAARDPLGLVPLTRPLPEPGERRRDVRDVGVTPRAPRRRRAPAACTGAPASAWPTPSGRSRDSRARASRPRRSPAASATACASRSAAVSR